MAVFPDIAVRCLAAVVAQSGGAGGFGSGEGRQSGCRIPHAKWLPPRIRLHFSNSPAVSGPEHRHCERSEAIHRATRKKAGLLRCARNDGEMRLLDLAAAFARVLGLTFRPPHQGAGNAGRPMRPIAACAEVVELSTRVSQVTPANTRHSPRNGFTAYVVLSPVIGLFCHRRLRKLLPANLTPASRRQDHTILPSAS